MWYDGRKGENDDVDILQMFVCMIGVLAMAGSFMLPETMKHRKRWQTAIVIIAAMVVLSVAEGSIVSALCLLMIPIYFFGACRFYGWISGRLESAEHPKARQIRMIIIVLLVLLGVGVAAFGCRLASLKV